MLPASSPLPFSIANVHNGFSEATGLARLSDKGIVLEYQVSLLGLFKFPIREVSVSFEDITAVALQKRFLRTTLSLHTRSLRTLASLPGSRTGQVRLRIAKRDREQAARWVSALRLHLSEQVLQRLTDNWHPQELAAG